MDMAPRTPTEHHYDLAEGGLADLGRVGFDDAGRTVEMRHTVGQPRSAPYRLIRAGHFLLPFGLDDGQPPFDGQTPLIGTGVDCAMVWRIHSAFRSIRVVVSSCECGHAGPSDSTETSAAVPPDDSEKYGAPLSQRQALVSGTGA